MDASKPSKIADLVAAARAAHMIRFNPRVFEDEFAYQMCGDFWRRILGSKFLTWLMVDVMLRDIAPLAPLVPARARYCEDIVDQLVREGVDQYVIIGAGHDSFAMRRTDLCDSLTVFELDQPGTQNEKRQRMARFNIDEPKNVQYISADLNEDELFTVLEQNGFQIAKRSIFSWFGVVYYLTSETVQETLANVASNAARGSELVFDFRIPLSNVPPKWQVAHTKIASYVAKKGEPFLSEFSTDAMRAAVLSSGMAEADIPSEEELFQLYFRELPPEAMLTPTFRFCRAICG